MKSFAAKKEDQIYCRTTLQNYLFHSKSKSCKVHVYTPADKGWGNKAVVAQIWSLSMDLP